MPDRLRQRLEWIINCTYIGLISLIVYLLIRYALGLVLPFLIALAIVTMVQPLIRKLKKLMKTQHPVVSFLAMLVLYAALGTGLFALIINLVFWLRDQFMNLSGYYDTSLAPSMSTMWGNLEALLRQMPAMWQDQFQTVQEALMQGIQSLLKTLSDRGLSIVSAFTGGIPGFLVAFIFTIMLSFFVSMQYDAVLAFLRNQLPPKTRGIVGEVKSILLATVLQYISAYLKLMCITFVEVSVGLLVLRVENAIFIGLLIAVFDALPVFGTGAIMIPWVLVEVIKGNFPLALGLAILYALVTVIRNMIEPKIIGDQLGLNPIVSLISIYLGFKLFGVLGMIVMPILTQILLELHKRGKLHLFREPAAKPVEQDE